MNHELKREYGGTGNMGWIRPTCSCGWQGGTEYAYNDYQHTEVARQESNHVRGTAGTPDAEGTQQ